MNTLKAEKRSMDDQSKEIKKRRICYGQCIWPRDERIRSGKNGQKRSRKPSEEEQ